MGQIRIENNHDVTRCGDDLKLMTHFWSRYYQAMLILNRLQTTWILIKTKHWSSLFSTVYVSLNSSYHLAHLAIMADEEELPGYLSLN